MIILNETLLGIDILTEETKFDSKINNLRYYERYNKTTGIYKGINVNIKFTKLEDIDDTRKDFIVKILNKMNKLDRKAKEYLADKCLELKNKEWNDDKPVTKNEFISKLKLFDIDFSNEVFMFWYSDGGLFDSHSLVVDFDNDNPDKILGYEMYG